MSDENNVIGLMFDSHVRPDGTYHLSPKLDPVLYDFHEKTYSVWQIDRKSLQDSIAENQKNIARINLLNAEKAALKSERDKWKNWYKFMAFMCSIQVFLYVALRYYI